MTEKSKVNPLDAPYDPATAIVGDPYKDIYERAAEHIVAKVAAATYPPNASSLKTLLTTDFAQIEERYLAKHGEDLCVDEGCDHYSDPHVCRTEPANEDQATLPGIAAPEPSRRSGSQLFNEPRGQRGGEIVHIPMHKLYDMLRDKLDFTKGFNGDPDAFCQQFCVHIEKQQGTYPNLPGMRGRGE